MLGFFFLKFSYFRFFQSGFYFDFFFKKLSELFVRNIFIYSSQFFGEKYMIEFFTKKIITNYVYNFINNYNLNNLFFVTFLYQILIFLFYILSIINIIFFVI